MATRKIELYVRIGRGRAFIVDEDNIKVSPSSYPVIHYSEVATVYLRPLNEDGTPWTLAELDAFGSYKFGLDDDFNRSTTPWVLALSTTSSFTTSNYDNVIGDPTFSGSGLDDAISSGTHTGTTAGTYTVQIDATGTPDSIRWRKGTAAWTTGANITSDNTLSEGVHILFTATTGHTLDDEWTIVASNAGQLYCEADAFTTAFSQGIGTSEAVDGNAEWQFLNNSDQDLIIQIPWILKGSIIDSGDTPPAASSQYVLVSDNPPVETSDPTGADLREGLLWFNSTDYVLRLYANSTTYNIGMTPKP